MAQTPLTLNNGRTIPALGFGTWQAAPGVVGQSVEVALEKGFRHIDCARIYRNEAEIGAAFQRSFAAGVARREDVFVTSKLWNTDHNPANVEKACRKTLADLQLEYLDLYLIHWPVALRHPEGSVYSEDAHYFPMNEQGGSHQEAGVTLLQTWAAMEALVDQGLVRAIGVSNYSEAQLREVFAAARIKPAVNQVEVQPKCPQDALRAVHKELGVVTEAYCPLGIGMGAPEGGVFQDAELQALAAELGVTSAALCLQWSLQLGNVVLSKSVTPDRIAANAAVPASGLSDAVMARIAAIGAKSPVRVCNPPVFYETAGPFFP